MGDASMSWIDEMVALVQADFESARAESVKADNEEAQARENAIAAQERFDLLRDLLKATLALQAARTNAEVTT
jgi:hypothetical protein